jgi:hypothetical protein
MGVQRPHAVGKGDKGFLNGNSRDIEQASCERASCAISMCAKVPGRVSAGVSHLPAGYVDAAVGDEWVSAGLPELISAGA